MTYAAITSAIQGNGAAARECRLAPGSAGAIWRSIPSLISPVSKQARNLSPKGYARIPRDRGNGSNAWRASISKRGSQKRHGRLHFLSQAVPGSARADLRGCTRASLAVPPGGAFTLGKLVPEPEENRASQFAGENSMSDRQMNADDIVALALVLQQHTPMERLTNMEVRSVLEFLRGRMFLTKPPEPSDTRVA